MWRSSMRFLAVSLGLAVLAYSAPKAWANVSADEMKKIEEACPKTAPAKPAKAHKILIYSHCNGFVHGGAIERTKIVLPMMGEKTGAYTAVVSDDLANFEPENLKKFDMVVLSNTTGELFELRGPNKPGKPDAKKIKDAAKLAQAEEKYVKDLAKYEEDLKAFKEAPKPDTAKLRESFITWVKDGGTVFGIHAATDCSYRWKEYGEMIGGWFAGHPWSEMVGVKNDDPTSPINASFDGKGFMINDEIYQFNRGIYSREKQRVLLSLDNDKIKPKGGRKDNDYAVSWIKPYGKGRVFYCSLGHRDEIFRTPAVLAHYLAGMQWALGDLKGVDCTPKPLAAAGVKGEDGKDGKTADVVVLFDGKNLDAWDFGKDKWVIQDDGSVYSNGKGGDIYSKEKFQDFILTLDFKVAKGTNSGVFVRMDNRKDWLNRSIEIQVLDSNSVKKPGKHDCGAMYDCLAPSANAVKKAGEWNSYKITCYKNILKVCLNGVEVINADLDKWDTAKKNPDGTPNKFRDPIKTIQKAGCVALQGHGNPVWYRNVKVQVLDPSKPLPTDAK